MWTEKCILRLIDLYRDKRLLWDQKHPHFYKKSAKNRAWEEVAGALGVTVDDCRKKMFSLHSSFRREKWKMRKSQGRDEVYTSTWFAFESMSFLLDKENIRKTTNRITTALKIEPIDHSEVRKRPREEPTDRLLLDRAEASSTCCHNYGDEDICQIFGNLVAKRMRVYSPLVQSAVQQAIMNVLFNADRGYYDQKSSCPSFDPSFPPHSQSLQHNQVSQNHNKLSASTRSRSPATYADGQDVSYSPTSEVVYDSSGTAEEDDAMSENEQKIN